SLLRLSVARLLGPKPQPLSRLRRRHSDDAASKEPPPSNAMAAMASMRPTFPPVNASGPDAVGACTDSASTCVTARQLTSTEPAAQFDVVSEATVLSRAASPVTLSLFRSE